MQKYRKKKKSKKKRKTYMANVLDLSAPLKVSLKRQRKAKRPQFTLQRPSSSGENLLKFKFLREIVGAENVSKVSSPSEIQLAKSAASQNIKKQPFKSAKSPLQQTLPITNEDVSLIPKKRGRPPTSQLPSTSKAPLSTLSKDIDDNIVKPKKRGRPSTVKTDDVPEPEIGESSKPEVEVKTEDIVEDEPLAKHNKTDSQSPKPLSLIVAPDAKNDQDETLLSEEKQFPIKRRGRPPKKAIIAELEAEAAAAAAAAEEAKAEMTKFEKPLMSTSGTVSLAGSGTLAAETGNEKAKERPQEVVTQKLLVDNTSKATTNEDSKDQPSSATPAKKRGRPKRVVTDEKIENLDSNLGFESTLTVEKGDASPASKRKRGPVIEQKEVATIVPGLEMGKLPKNAKITEERPKSEEAKQNDKVKSSKLLEVNLTVKGKVQTPASDAKKPEENVKVAKAIDEKPAEKIKAAKPIDEKPAEKIKVAKPIDEKPAENIKAAKTIDEKPAEKINVAKAIDEKLAEKIKVAKAIDEKPAEKIKVTKAIEQKSEEKIKVPKPIVQKPAEKIRVTKPIDEKPEEKIKAAKVIDEKPAGKLKMAKVLPEKAPEKVKSPKAIEVKPSEKVKSPKILVIQPKILEPKPTEKIKSPRLVLETKPADKIKVAKTIDEKTAEKIKVAKAIDEKSEENIKVAKPIEQKPAEKIKIKIYDAKPLPEKVKSPKPEKEKVKSPKIMAQSSEINDNRYVVQSVAANPLKIKLKTGSFGSDLNLVKAPLKLKVSLKDCSSSGELSGGITKKKKHKKKKQRARSPSSGHQDTSKPIILRIKSPTNKRPEEPTAAVVKVEKIKAAKAIDEKPSGSGNNGYLVGIKKSDDKVSSINDISAAKKPVTPAGAGVAPVGAERDTRAPSSASDHGAASMVTFSPESSPEHKVQTNFFMPSTSAKSFDSAEIGLGEGQFKDLMKAIDSDDESKPSVSTKAEATASNSPRKGSLSWLSEAKASTSAASVASAASSASVKQSQVDGTIDSWSRSSSISQSSPIHLSENEKDEKDEDSSDNLEKQSVIHKRMKQILDRPKTKGNLIKNIFFKVAKKRKIVVVRYRKPDQRMYDLDEYFDRKETERLDEPYDEDVDDPTMMKQPKTFKNSHKQPQPSSSSSSPMSFTHVRFSSG